MSKLPKCSEYVDNIEVPQLIKAPSLKGGRVLKRNDTVIRYAGGFCVVFPFQTANGKYAVRCWHAQVDNAQERTRCIAEELQKVHLPYFVGFDYVQEGIATSLGIQPIVVMDWVEAVPLKEYIGQHITDSKRMLSLAESFLQMVKDLHRHHISHGDLQHGNILVSDTGRLVLVDYDSMYVPALEGFSDDIKGLEGYQHPARRRNRNLSPKADYFSELVIYTSLRALARFSGLWEELGIKGTETLLFTAEDINSGGTSSIFHLLDQDEELAPMSAALKASLECSSINELRPLEEVLISPVDSISFKWVDNGYIPPMPDYEKGVDKIREGWNKPQPVRTEVPNIDEIRRKW